MLSSARSRLCLLAGRASRLAPRATYSSVSPRLPENPIPANDPNPPKKVPNVSETNAVPLDATGQRDEPLQELPQQGERYRQLQAPNRASTWSKGQRPREEAMVGPRFEQTIMEYQPQPHAAIELIHRQPVRWTKDKVVSCDGGGGPLGHPKVFINTDKPQIAVCGYCGLPFANEHNREKIEALPTTSYPLKPLGHPAEVAEEQGVTDHSYEQR